MKRILMILTAAILCIVMMVPVFATEVHAATTNDYNVEVYFTGNTGLPLHYSADANTGIYFYIPERTSLHIDSVVSGWGHTVYNGYNGWVQLKYTKIIGEYPMQKPASGWVTPAYYRVYNTEGEGLELRCGPGSENSTFGPMYDGAIMTVEAINGDWFYGLNDGVYGWAHSSYLQYVSQASTTPVASDSTKVVTIGTDLTDEQEAFIIRYFGADLSQCRVIYVNNQQEREYLGSWIPLSEIGNVTISCAYVQPTTYGGIQVKTANLTYVTGNMIASVLSTAGVTNCNVVAAAPFPVSGTGALTGIMIAYQNATNTTLDESKKDLAIQEYTVTQQLGQSIGTNEALQLVNAIKMEVIQSGNLLNSGVSVETIVNQVILNMDLSITNIDNSVVYISNGLTDADRQLLLELAEAIANQNYNYDDVRETLERVEDNLAEETNINIEITIPEDTGLPLDGEDVSDTYIPSQEDSILSNTDDSMIDDSLRSDTRQEDEIVPSAPIGGMYSGWQEAYRALLEMESVNILGYDYQNHGALYGTQNVFLCDVYGDETPELIYIKIEYMQPGMDAFWNPAYLHIVTCENGNMRELYSGAIDKPKAAGGYCYYYLFQVTGEKTLYWYDDSGDDGGAEEYYRFVVSADNCLVPESICRLSKDGPGNVTECIVNGVAAGMDAFYGAVADLQGRTVGILIYSCQSGEYADSYVAIYGCPAMDYYTAFEYIRQQIDSADRSDPNAPEDAEWIDPNAPENAEWIDPNAPEPVDWYDPSTPEDAAWYDPSAPEDLDGYDSEKVFNSWQEAYYDFIYNGGYLNVDDIYPEGGLSGGVQFALWDMTGERTGEIPELIVDNNADGMSWACSIFYTYDTTTGRLLRVGETDWHSIAGMGGKLPDSCGVFAANFYYVKFYLLNVANDLFVEDVKTGVEDGDSAGYPLTIYNESLYDIYENHSVELNYYFKWEIDEMGWDAFCNSYYPVY